MAKRELLTETLARINENPECLAEYKGHTFLKTLFEHAFLPENKFVLPDGDPPFKPSAEPLGMTPTNILQEMRRLYIFTEKQPLHKVKRETLFIELLEGVHPDEAKVLCAVKDQKLQKLYKKITPELAAKHGFIPEQVKEKKSGKQGSKQS